MKTRKIIIVILLIIVGIALIKKGTNAVKRRMFDHTIETVQNLMLKNAKGKNSMVRISMDTINSYFSDSITKRVVICLDTENSDSSYMNFISQLGHSNHTLVITNFKDSTNYMALSKRFTTSEIDFINLKAWPIVRISYPDKLVFQLDSSGLINHAFIAKTGDIGKIKDLINKANNSNYLSSHKHSLLP